MFDFLLFLPGWHPNSFFTRIGGSHEKAAQDSTDLIEKVLTLEGLLIKF